MVRQVGGFSRNFWYLETKQEELIQEVGSIIYLHISGQLQISIGSGETKVTADFESRFWTSTAQVLIHSGNYLFSHNSKIYLICDLF